MLVYYGDNELFCAQWLRNLCRQDLIPKGHVDDRSIADVRPSDLVPYSQHHFFAGIGGWPYALRLAGWPDDRPVWTASLPCQPFSVAGMGAGTSDERHMWPVFRTLVTECRPEAIFGEQVASPLGRAWLSRVFDDLEDGGYAVWAAIIPAGAIGAPHQRHRIFWSAFRLSNSNCPKRRTLSKTRRPEERHLLSQGQESTSRSRYGSEASGLRDPSNIGCEERDAISQGRPDGSTTEGRKQRSWNNCIIVPGADGNVWGGHPRDKGLPERTSNPRSNAENKPAPTRKNLGSTSPWDEYVIVPCTDGKMRPIEPGLMPVANGVPQRVGRVRAYGNAIVPQVAAAFILAALD